MPETLTAALQQELQVLNRQIEELTNRKRAIENLLNTYRGLPPGKQQSNLVAMPKATSMLSTLDMAEQLLKKNGEMKAEEIMEAIRTEFGVKPAHTLPQMLYIRARTKKRFYRSSAGKFGVIENRRKQAGKGAAA